MAKDPSGTAFKTAFLIRTRVAREARPYTQDQIAGILGIAQDTYKQYETRSFLPHHLVAKFCVACGINATWLFTGAGRAPVMAAKPEKERIAAKGRARRAAA